MTKKHKISANRLRGIRPSHAELPSQTASVSEQFLNDTSALYAIQCHRHKLNFRQH